MHHLVVDINRREKLFNFKELLHYKDLFLILAYRDLRVRYAQSFIGVFWVLFQQFVTISISTVLFGRVMNVDTEDALYPLFGVVGFVNFCFFMVEMLVYSNFTLSLNKV